MDVLSSLRQAHADARAVYGKNVPYEVGRADYTALPTYKGKSYQSVLDERKQAGEKTALLDVGCGKGEFLVEQKQRYGNQFVCHGISSYPYHDIDRMITLGVDIQVVDVQRLHRRNTYDVVTAMHSLQYVPNPLFALKQIYSSLRQNGVAFIYPFPLQCIFDKDENQLVNYLRQKYGFEIKYVKVETGQRWWAVSFQKTTTSLRLPVSICRMEEYGVDRYGVNQAVYRFNET